MAGTDATDAQGAFRLDLGWFEGSPVVSFPTVPAGGSYGLGGPRRYALEQADATLTSGGWQGVAGLTNVFRRGAVRLIPTGHGEANRRFFRGFAVWLAP